MTRRPHVNWHPTTSLVRYISDGTWFDDGTEAFIVDDYRKEGYEAGLFEGLKEGKWDQELCDFDEFIVLGHHSE